MSEMTLPATGRAWHLESRPEGWPVPSDFALREEQIPAPGPGQLLVANEYLSVDPYMRGRMSAKKSYRRCCVGRFLGRLER
jgi:NADPH-dependent curcumin reductase CurA